MNVKVVEEVVAVSGCAPAGSRWGHGSALSCCVERGAQVVGIMPACRLPVEAGAKKLFKSHFLRRKNHLTIPQFVKARISNFCPIRSSFPNPSNGNFGIRNR